MIHDLWRDLSYALRALRKPPAFAWVAVLTLAVGIGSATAMFSVVQGVLLRPLPVGDQSSVVVLSMQDRRNASTHLPIPYSVLRDLRQNSRAFAEIAGMHMLSESSLFVVRDGDRVRSMEGAFVTGNLFSVLGGVSPVLGRSLTAADDADGAPDVAVLSHAAWRGPFGGDSAVIGRSVRMMGGLYTIVGVMPPGLELPRGTQIWAPVLGYSEDPGSDLVGRLRPGVTLEQGRAEVAAMVRRHQASDAADVSIRARPILRVIIGDMRSRLLVLSAAVALVLLIACGNVATLILGRGETRTREVALRTALGAGRWRLVRQVLTESLVLAVLGGLAGVFAAVGLLRLLLAFAPPELPRLDAVHVDGVTLLFAAGVSGLAVLLSALVPAVRAVRTNTAGVLKAGAPMMAGGWKRDFGRRLLVAGQVALALVVLVSASLLVRSLAQLQTLDVGFAKDQLAIAKVVLPTELLQMAAELDADHAPAAYATMLDAVRTNLLGVPGIIGVTPLMGPPFSALGGRDLEVVPQGSRGETGGAYPAVSVQVVSGDFFRIFDIPLLRGRMFAQTDHANAPAAAIVNESLARLLWPGDDPLNRSVRVRRLERSPTVIGVVAGTRYRELTSVRPTLYVPVRQVRIFPSFLGIRTRGDPRSLLPSIRRTINQSGLLQATWLATIDDLLAEPLARPRFSTLLIGTFAVIALILVAVGVHSVLALFVRQRTHELGVRMALGADRVRVHRMVLWQGMKLALVGAGVGMAVALLTTGLLESLLFDIAPKDPLTLAGAAVFLLSIVAAACWIPARRATRVSPMTVLRSE